MEYCGYAIVRTDDSLQHYGRMGMRWGKHIYGEEEAFNRASEHAKKLDAKVQKRYEKVVNKRARNAAKISTRQAKYDMAKAKSDYKTIRGRRFTGIKRTTRLARSLARAKKPVLKAEGKYAKSMAKTTKFLNKMNKEFDNKKVGSIKNDKGYKLGDMYIKKYSSDMMKW